MLLTNADKAHENSSIFRYAGMLEKIFTWSQTLEVGHPLMDEEHKEIIRRMGRLYELNSKIFDKKTLIMGMDELIRFTKQHFADEEELMLKAGYPGLAMHQKIHAGLFNALERYQVELDTSVYNRYPSSVFDFMKTWITTHIMIVDQQYAQFLREKNVTA